MEARTAICNLSMMPVRSEPAHRSEMVSMLLFGETFIITETKENWHKIKCSYDGYEGWITARKLHEVSAEFIKTYAAEAAAYVSGFPFFAIKGKEKTLLSPGSRLPDITENTFKLGNEQYSFDGEIIISEDKPQQSAIIKTAQIFLGTPYLWGGRSILGIDCSGFTQLVFLLCGYKLPRDAYQQAELGETVNNLAEAKAGDLAFFSENNSRITHVGILDGHGNIIHASEKVKVDTIDGKGIFNAEIKQHTLKATVIKRYF